MRLDREPCAGRRADRSSGQHVVAEDEIRRQVLEERGSIRRHVAVQLFGGQILEQARLEAFVRVEHEHGQQPAGKLRPHDGCAGEVEAFGLRLLAEHRDVVPRAAPGPGDRLRVDVRARAREKVPVPEENLHSIEEHSHPRR